MRAAQNADVPEVWCLWCKCSLPHLTVGLLLLTHLLVHYLLENDPKPRAWRTWEVQWRVEWRWLNLSHRVCFFPCDCLGCHRFSAFAADRETAKSSQMGFKTTVPDCSCNSVCSSLSSSFPSRKGTPVQFFPSAPLTRQWQRKRGAEPQEDKQQCECLEWVPGPNRNSHRIITISRIVCFLHVSPHLEHSFSSVQCPCS